LKKLRDFSADRVGDSLHSLVFREDSRAIGWTRASRGTRAHSRGKSQERPDKFTRCQTDSHTRTTQRVCVCVGRFV
jgi:hypothetical protein